MKLKINKKLLKKLFTYADVTSREISGLGFINSDNEIYDLVLFKQESSSGETDLDIDDVHNYINSLIEKDPNKIENLKLWFHSHANMGVFWSKTDEECIEGLLETTPELYSIVINKKGEYKLRLDVLYKKQVHFQDEDVELEVIWKERDAIHTLIEKKGKTLNKHIIEKYPEITEITLKYEDNELAGISFKDNPKLTKKEIDAIKKEVEEKNKKPVTKSRKIPRKSWWKKDGWEQNFHYMGNNHWQDYGYMGNSVTKRNGYNKPVPDKIKPKKEAEVDYFGTLPKVSKKASNHLISRYLEKNGLRFIFSTIDYVESPAELAYELSELGLLEGVKAKFAKMPKFSKRAFPDMNPFMYLHLELPDIKQVVINYCIDRITAKGIKKSILLEYLDEEPWNTFNIWPKKGIIEVTRTEQ